MDAKALQIRDQARGEAQALDALGKGSLTSLLSPFSLPFILPNMCRDIYVEVEQYCDFDFLFFESDSDLSKDLTYAHLAFLFGVLCTCMQVLSNYYKEV